MAKQDTKKSNPPYISAKKLEQLLGLLSTRSLGHVSKDDLTSRGFSLSDAFQALQALKFLNLIDDDGNVTDDAKKLILKGDQKKSALEEIVKSSYQKLFDTVPEPYSLSKDDLHNEFIAVYKLSGRLARTAVPAFLWLSTEAGLRTTSEKKSVLKRKTYPSERVPRQEIVQDRFIDFNEFPFSGSVKLSIPKSLSSAQILQSDEFKQAISAVEKLAKKITKEDEPGKKVVEAPEVGNNEHGESQR